MVVNKGERSRICLAQLVITSEGLPFHYLGCISFFLETKNKMPLWVVHWYNMHIDTRICASHPTLLVHLPGVNLSPFKESDLKGESVYQGQFLLIIVLSLPVLFIFSSSFFIRGCTSIRDTA